MRLELDHIIKRILVSVISFFIVATLLFFLFRAMPGDAADLVLDPGMSPEARERLRESYGLNHPWYVQYFQYMTNILTLNLGESFVYSESVTGYLSTRLLNTLTLVLTGVIIAYTLGPVIGAYLAWKRGSNTDTLGTGLVLLMYAAPVFWTGMVAIMIFSFNLGLVPSGGMHSAGYSGEGFLTLISSVEFYHHLILPLIVGTLYWMAPPTFFMRSNMIDVLKNDFIEMNKAQGLPELSIIYRHAARNAMLPVLHYSAVAIGFAFGGSILVEVVFSWPGIGQAMWDAVQQRDYPVAQGSFLIMSAVIITANFVVDILSVYVDPRAAEMDNGGI